MVRRNTITVIMFFFTLFLFGEGSTEKDRQVQGERVDLTVKIDNIKKVTGEMELGLYDKAENFPKVGKQYLLVKRKVTGHTFTYTFQDLPPGEYALAVFHDRNTDGKINKNFLGIPTEPYGFSNNIRPKLSAPPFAKTKFRVVADTTVSITLLH
jgi:uncharacterized protein (DUF2141 family)